jgi:hypothetical protein
MRNNKIIVWFVFLFLWTYLILRAINIPLFHDEAATFFHFVLKAKFIPPYAHWDANNHILNSALTYISYNLFGPSELVLRLSNILLFPLFVYFSFRISNEISNKYYRWAFFICCCFSHGLIEFFAYSRGYGMSMAFLMGAVWFLIRIYKETSLKDYLLCFFFMILFLIANLTLINSAIIIICLAFLKLFSKLKSQSIASSFKTIMIILFAGCLPLYFFIRLSFEYKKRGLLYYGSLDGFWNQTVRSLMKLFLQSESPIISLFIIVFFIIIIAIFVFLLVKNRNRQVILNTRMLFFYLLIGNLIAVLLLARFLKVYYPQDRTALYFFIFFVGSVFFLLDQLNTSGKKWISLVTIIPFLIFPLHFFLIMNLSYSTFWKVERLPKRFCDTIYDYQAKEKHKFTIGGEQNKRLILAYYSFQKGGQLNQMQCESFPEMISDFQVVYPESNLLWKKYYRVIDRDQYTGLCLLKRIKLLEKKPLFEIDVPVVSDYKEEYYGIYANSNADSLKNKTLCIDFNFSISAKQRPPILSFVAAITNEKNENIVYEYINLDWIKLDWNGEKGNFTASLLLNKIHSDAKLFSVYIWNIKKAPFTLNESYCTIYELKTDF